MFPHNAMESRKTSIELISEADHHSSRRCASRFDFPQQRWKRTLGLGGAATVGVLILNVVVLALLYAHYGVDGRATNIYSGSDGCSCTIMLC